MDKKTVLLIEDKEVVATLMMDILIGTGRYEVVSAPTGRQGLQIILGDESADIPSNWDEMEKAIEEVACGGLDVLPHSKRFDLVLSDVRMPGIDGINTLKLVKKLCPNQNCILITGYGMEDRQQDIEEIGPSMILRKPLTNDELVSAVDEACNAITVAS